MSPARSIFAAVIVLVMQLYAGEGSCTVWSSDGPVVKRGSTFRVYCFFKYKCTGSMYSHDPETHQRTLQRNMKFNFTTIYFEVVNITRNQTYSCWGNCHLPMDDCGLDMAAGYPPDSPKSISCVNKVISNKRSVVLCSWGRGRDTYLWNSAVLHVRTLPRNHTVGPVTSDVSNKENDLLSASFNVSTSVQLITVWVQVHNALGSAASVPVNYTLSDIAMPPSPGLGQPNCSSRECVIEVELYVTTQHLEIEYGAKAQTWSSYQDSGVHTSLTKVQLSSLEPYGLYYFRVRSKFSTGLWSEWSTKVFCQTQEEAPAKELDAWYVEPDSDFKSLRVFWKEPNTSISRGKITQYRVRVYSQNSGVDLWENISANFRNYLVPFCADCEVTVWSCNSKGVSPPARLSTHYKEDDPLEVVLTALSNRSVTISWGKHGTARQPAGYVVEWYPEGHKLEELRWVRLGRNDNHTVITGLAPFECYAGAVYVVYNDGPASRTRFTGVTTQETVPAAVPSVREKVEENRVRVSWMEVPREQRGGCITSYTIYLESNGGQRKAYTVPASERTYTIKDLSSAAYTLWVTASTAKGEGLTGLRSKVKFFIQYETQLSLSLMCVAVIPVIALICLYKIPTVKQRVWMLFQCFALDNVPDPANSKWAKECTQEKGEMKLQLQLSNCSVTEEEDDEEEDPILVDVEELPKQSCDDSTAPDVSSQLLPQTRLSHTTEPDVILYPATTYIKSFSHDSDSSNYTHTSGETNTTIDYISAHEPEHLDEEYQDGEDDDEHFHLVMDFFPSHSTAIEELRIGGKLTLDTVKINCSNLFQNEHF